MKLKNGTILWDGLYFPSDKYYIAENRTEIRGCVCDITKCFRKCCPWGQGYIDNKCSPSNETLVKNFQIPVYEAGERTHVTNDHFVVIINKYCENGAYKLDPSNHVGDNHWLQTDGKLFQNATGGIDIQHPQEKFCMEYFEESNDISALICFSDGVVVDEIKEHIYSVGTEIA